MLCLGTGGCETIENVLNEVNMTKPTASITDVHLIDLGLESTTLAFDVKIKNPYGVALPLLTTDYALTTGANKTPFLNGKATPSDSIPAHGSATITLPAIVHYDALLTTLSNVYPGAVLDYNATLGLSVDAPVTGPLRLPVTHKGQLPIPNVPKVELTNFKWDQLTLNKASAVFDLNIKNTNDFPIDLEMMNYDLTLAGVNIANASLSEAASFGIGSSANLQIPLSFSPIKLGLAAFNMLKGDGAAYHITGNMTLQSPFGPMNLPFDSAGNTDFDH